MNTLDNNDKSNQNPKNAINRIVIEGITEKGQKFRPSDWAERMSGKLSTFHNHRIYYSPLLYPIVKDGNKCILLDERLRESNPNLYQSILDFATENQLRICKDESAQATDSKSDAL